MAKARKDLRGRALKKGEVQRKSDQRYMYTYTDPLGRRKFIYANDLTELREKELELQRQQLDGLDLYAAGKATVNDTFDRYMATKYELRDSTKNGYLYTYDHFIRDNFGLKKMIDIKYSDVLQFYYYLLNEKGIALGTLDSVHCLLHPTFQLAVRDDIIKPFLTVYKKYAPNTKKTSISETEKVIKELSLCEAEVQRKRENSELDSQDLSLLNHKDVQVKTLAFGAFGGDNEYLGILGNIFMTKIYERNAPIDIPYNPAKGVSLLEKAAAKGNDTAKVNLGMYYLVGNGVPRNISKARKYIEEAYDNGNSVARELMGDYRVLPIL